MTRKYILQERSPLCKAMKQLLQMFAVPVDHIIANGEHFAVMEGLKLHVGVMPLLATLRTSTEDAALLAFAGADEHVLPLVNQWVSTASLLSSDATLLLRGAGAACTPLAKHAFAEIERGIESFGLQKSFLASTPRATVADFLLYAAIHCHPNGEEQARQSTVAWSHFVQSDEYLAPIISESVATAVAAKAAKKSATPVYVKPSEEEIIRRREEKERAKVLKSKSGEEGKATKEVSGKGQKKKDVETLDPSRLDVRVGRFTNVKTHPDADRLYVEEMDLGTEKRTIVSGLVEQYKLEELEGMLCLAVCNMKPKPLKGITSHGMVLCASNEQTLRLVPPPEGAQPGDRILFADALDMEKLHSEPPAQLSSNAMGDLIGFLRTDGEGVMRWKDTPAHHAKGIVSIPEVPNASVR